VTRAAQHQREGSDVGVGGDAAQVLLGGQIGRDHDGGLAQERDTARRPGVPQPSAQVIPEGDQPDDRDRYRPE